MEAQTQIQLLTEIELSKLLAVSVAALRRWRREGRGPRFIRPGGRLVRYRVQDVSSWLDEGES